MPWRRIRYTCDTANTMRHAGSRNTWAEYQRSSVSAPSDGPPRISPAMNSPNGPLRAMLIVTVVAQYAFWSHGSR